MRKSQFAIFSGILLSVFLVLSCSNSSGGSDDNGNNASQNKQYFTVTFDAGSLGYFDYNTSLTKKEVKVEKGKVCSEEKPIITSNNNYSYIYEYEYYCKKGDSVPFDFSTSITENIILEAKYGIKVANNLDINTKFDGTKFEISLSHPSSYYNIDNFNYHITVVDTSTNQQIFEKEGPIYRCNYSSIEVTNLTHASKYLIKVESIYGEEHSKSLEKTAYPAKSTKVLLLMYLDGDNDLNNPIFLDINEIEYGLSKLSAEQQKDLTVLALWDGWIGDGKKTYYGGSASRLIQLGADEGELYSNSILTEAAQTLSDKTIDLSDKVDWLANGEVDMSDKNTLKNFLTFAKSIYYTSKTDNIILTFSNHGAGPRSATVAKTVKSFNDKDISYNDLYRQRAICIDESTGKETLLKTSEISSVLTEVGYSGYKNQIGLIIEDVCLGGSIEEAYELKDNTSYYLGSPNNAPDTGMDYTTLISAIKENILEASFENVLTVANKVCRKYVEDYSITEDDWKSVYENFIESNGINEAELSDSDISSIKALLSVHDPYLCTISLFTTSSLNGVKDALNKVVDEILQNGNIKCKNYFYDQTTNSITNSPSESTIEISRHFMLLENSLRPYDDFSSTLIQYRGNFSWLYDLGSSLIRMYQVANNENWTTLTNYLEQLSEKLDGAINFAWRDGYGQPTYNSDILSCKGKPGWLPSDILYVFYGITISGETVKYTVDGNTITFIDGEYPSWYTELKFGQDCKWNDLLKYWFGSN